MLNSKENKERCDAFLSMIALINESLQGLEDVSKMIPNMSEDQKAVALSELLSVQRKSDYAEKQLYMLLIPHFIQSKLLSEMIYNLTHRNSKLKIHSVEELRQYYMHDVRSYLLER